ncbi:MAG: hypothetical protein MUC33_16920 [Desulfobacterales bacterium]|nr:hypothetical protein [Desulfobacterales bacterium]
MASRIQEISLAETPGTAVASSLAISCFSKSIRLRIFSCTSAALPGTAGRIFS